MVTVIVEMSTRPVKSLVQAHVVAIVLCFVYRTGDHIVYSSESALLSILPS